MNNKEYWQERMDNALSLSEKEVLKPLKKIYKSAYNNIKDELINIWLDMVNDGEISQSFLYQNNRMSNLQTLIARELNKLGNINVEYMQTSFFNTFQQGFEDMSTFLGLTNAFSFLDKQVANEIIKQNYKGANFSERIWNDINKLRIQIEDIVTKSALQGKDVRKVAKELQGRMNVSYSDSKRITVTETARIFNESCRQKALNSGYTSYSVLVEPDACKDCVSEFTGKHFNINESVLPRHPHCKCCMIIDIDK